MMYLVTRISNLYHQYQSLKNLTLEDAQCVSSGVIFFIKKTATIPKKSGCSFYNNPRMTFSYARMYSSLRRILSSSGNA